VREKWRWFPEFEPEAAEGVSGSGGHHGECRARAYNEGLGAESPAGSRGRAPGQGVRPPEAESILVTGCPTEPANLAPFQKCPFILTENSMLCYGPLVSELGAESAWCPPTPSLGGLCPPALFPPGSAAYGLSNFSVAFISLTHFRKRFNILWHWLNRWPWDYMPWP